MVRKSVYYATLQTVIDGCIRTNIISLRGVSNRDVRRYVNRNKTDFCSQFCLPLKDAHKIKCVSVK